MNAIEHDNLLRQPFFNFLKKALGTERFEVFSLAGDASNRKYYRVIRGTEAWVLMFWEPFVDDNSYPFLSVQRHFAKNNVQVPQVIDMSPKEGFVLLEDLGDLTLERKFWELHNQDLVIPFYQQALDEILKIHYRSTDDKSDCTAFKIAFDTEKLLWEMNYGLEHVLEKFNQIRLTNSEQKILQECFLGICQRLDKEEKRIAHRDYHSRNLMIKLGKMRVIDFQDARMGPIQYDLVSLLKDSYVSLEDRTISSLIDYYLEKRRGLVSKDISRAHFDEIFELQSIQRCFKACGSFASFFNIRSDTRYLKYIAPTLQRVKLSLEKFPQYKDFADVLSHYGLFEQRFEMT